MPATIVATLPDALAPLCVGTRTRPDTTACRPHDCASRITGASPACDTRFGSSNNTRELAAAYANLTPTVPFRTGRSEPEELRSSQLGRASSRLARRLKANSSVDQGLAARPTGAAVICLHDHWGETRRRLTLGGTSATSTRWPHSQRSLRDWQWLLVEEAGASE